MGTTTQQSLLKIYQQEPLNAGTPLPLLRRSFLTPQKHFFVRCHGSIPRIDPQYYRLMISGMVQHPLALSLNELRSRFPERTVTATLQCVGSRRDELMKVRPIPDEIAWGADAISTAVWRGVLLRDILQEAGADKGAIYVNFTGLDEVYKEGQQVGFGCSITLQKALTDEVLLAYALNEEPLTPEHGFPVRVIVPGYIGARNVKWLHSVILHNHPSNNYFQTHSYKMFPPDVTEENVNWEQGTPIEEIPLNSVICLPQEGETLKRGQLRIQGYAITGRHPPVTRVELSTDGGQQWLPATITHRGGPFAWCFWEAMLDAQPGETEIISRAWDSLQQTQPQDAAPLWNLGGYANNAWHRIHIHIK
jgi:sulfite oxidase